MNDKSSKTCRLCLQTINNGEYDTIKDVHRKMLIVLRLNLNLDISEGPIICTDCTKNLEKYHSFKSACLSVEDHISSCVNSKVESKIDLSEVYLNERKDADELINWEIKRICRLCMKLATVGHFKLLCGLESDSYVIRDVLHNYMPEIDLTSTDEPIICNTCRDILHSYFKFTTTCLNVEDKIGKYIDVKGIDCGGQVMLHNVLDFVLQLMSKDETSCNNLNKVKMEQDHIKNTECVAVKAEVQEADFLEMKDIDLNIKNEECDIKIEESCGSIESMHSLELKEDIDVHVTLNEQTPNYKPETYGGEPEMVTQHSPRLQSFLKNNSTAKFKCHLCRYKTDVKKRYNIHTLVHKKPSEISMFKCNLCSFETKYKGSLKQHMLTHMKPSEINMYKCEMCTYETKHKSCFRLHLLVHKNPSETTMYKCDSCSYETKRKSHIKLHVQTHKTSSRIKMFKCHVCMHQMKRKSSLTRHLLKHEKHPEVTYQCQTCTYQTQIENNLVKHVETHKNSSGASRYVCDACTFEVKEKTAFEQHLLTHIKRYKCELCGYKTNHKVILNRHMLTHKGDKIKNDLQRHATHHGDPLNEVKESGEQSASSSKMRGILQGNWKKLNIF